jgi:hypothetical protein
MSSRKAKISKLETGVKHFVFLCSSLLAGLILIVLSGSVNEKEGLKTSWQNFVKSITVIVDAKEYVPLEPPLVKINPLVADNLRVDGSEIREEDVPNTIVIETPKKKMYFCHPEVKVAEMFFEFRTRKRIEVDPMIWQPSDGWLSNAQLKWVVEKKWGAMIMDLCVYFNMSNCYDDIVAIIVHESMGSPWAVNDISGATGLGQFVFTTAMMFTFSEEYLDQFTELDRAAVEKIINQGQKTKKGKGKRKFDFKDYFFSSVQDLNRADPVFNIILTIIHFKKNYDTFKGWGYKNPIDWADLGHNTGSGGAADTAAFYAGYDTEGDVCKFVYEAPFWQLINGIRRLKPVEPPLWCWRFWQEEDWENLEKIRHIPSSGRLVSDKEFAASRANKVLSMK